MKRFGLPILLSAVYVGLLLLVFSSDFSKEHSFLLPKEVACAHAKAAEKGNPIREESLDARISSLLLERQGPFGEIHSHDEAELQSPESAHSGD